MKLPIPITVLTGYLGSGKTTVLKHLLRQPDMAGTAVIVNEFGDVGLDDALIEAAEEDTVLLPSGCVCCAVRGDLIEALKRLAERAMAQEIAPLERIIIETTGLADPAPIAHTLMTEEDLFRFYALDGIVATIDAELGLDQIDRQFEPAKQIAVADLILITKIDRVPAEMVARVKARVRALNPAAQIQEIANGVISAGAISGLAAFEPVAVRNRADDWLAPEAYGHAASCGDPDCDHPHHDHTHAATAVHGHLHGVSSFCLNFAAPLDGRKLSFALELLRQTYGDRLLRIKGIVHVKGEPEPFVIHGVQHVFYPPAALEAERHRNSGSRIVFITRDLDEATVREVFAPLFEMPAVRAPDYESWTER